MTNEQLLRRLQAGDQTALEALMQKYHRYVYTIIANILGRQGTTADAEELTADTFYAVWEHTSSIHNLKSYLGSTARNKAINHLRRQRELPMDLDTIDLPDPSPDLEDQLLRRELARRVREAIEKMRPRDREIFLRYYYYAQTTEEIAILMDLPAATVRSRLARGRAKLKTILSKEASL